MWQKIVTKLHQKNVQVVLVGTSSLASGLAVGYAVATRRMETKYSQIAEQEIAEAKAYYATLNEKPSMDELAEKYKDEIAEEVTPAEEDEAAQQGLAKIRNYQSPAMQEEVQDEEEKEVVREEIRRSRRNIFDHRPQVRDFDWDEELKRREDNTVDPFVITKDEYMANETNYVQTSLTWFNGDDTLADEKDMPVQDVEGQIGLEALTQFGYGSEDANIVYVRNPRTGHDMEVVYSEREYAQDVGGLRHSSEDLRRSGGKFRGFDE